MRGWVRSFLNDRGYGFIEGDDGQDYFFHIDDLRGHELPVPRQEVSFTPDVTAKGPRARSVMLSARAQRAQQIYVNPDHFIMTRDTEIRGYVIVRMVGQNFWGESNDPNAAREILKQQAQSRGANAIVGLNLQKYTKAQACSNYRYTMHRFYGNAVIAKKVSYTTDTNLIARSRAEMQALQDGTTYHSLGNRSLTRPPLWKFVPTLMWALMRTLVMIAIVAMKQALASRTRRQQMRAKVWARQAPPISSSQ